ncbi:hypothetical protein Droror1_Dr00025828 [Drosera rotundifolia]
MEATNVSWEQVDALPCLTKIPADVLYLKFIYTSNPWNPDFERIFIFKLRRESLAKSPAEMIPEILVAMTPLLYSTPESDKAFAKQISMQATSRLKKQDRVFGFLMEICGVPIPCETRMRYVTWSASGTMTRYDRVFLLCSDSRYYDLNGTLYPGECVNSPPKKNCVPCLF